MRPDPLRLVAAFLLVSVSLGCATHSRDMAKVRESLLDNDIQTAIEEFEDKKVKDSDLLYLLEAGHMMHMAGRWEESNWWFHLAELRADELYTKSISRQALSLVSNDLVLPYRSAAHELQFVQYYRALNYLALGLPQEALVEARKSAARLDQWARESGPLFRQDAFLQYFTGLLFESRREVNDAIISFRNSAHRYDEYTVAFGYPAPSWLAEDYFAAAAHLGLDDEVDSLLQYDSSVAERSELGHENNLIVFFEAGFVPYRERVDIALPIYKADGSDEAVIAQGYVDEYGNDIYAYRKGNVKLKKVLAFSFPELIDIPTTVASCELDIMEGPTVGAEYVLDLAAVARADFESRLPGILLKTIARAVAKDLARKAAADKDEDAGWAINILNIATEHADTRGWIFLPGHIFMLKTQVPPGQHILRGRFLSATGETVDEWEADVEVRPGGTEFVWFRSFR